MLEGWTPILLVSVVVAIIIFFMSRKVTKKILLLISIVLSLICVGILIYSIEVVGGWAGIGIGVVTLSCLFGIGLGTISGAFIKSK